MTEQEECKTTMDTMAVMQPAEPYMLRNTWQSLLSNSNLPGRYRRSWKQISKIVRYATGSGNIIRSHAKNILDGFNEFTEASTPIVRYCAEYSTHAFMLLIKRLSAQGKVLYDVIDRELQEYILYQLMFESYLDGNNKKNRISLIRCIIAENKDGFDRKTTDYIIESVHMKTLSYSKQELENIIRKIRVIYVDDSEELSMEYNDLFTTDRYSPSYRPGSPYKLSRWEYAILNNFKSVDLSKCNGLSNSKDSFSIKDSRHGDKWTSPPTYEKHIQDNVIGNFDYPKWYSTSGTTDHGEHREYHWHLGASMKIMFEELDGYLVPRSDISEEQAIMLARTVARAVFTDQGRLELLIHPAILVRITMRNMKDANIPWEVVEELVGKDWIEFLSPEAASQKNFDTLLKDVRNKCKISTKEYHSMGTFTETIRNLITDSIAIGPLKLSWLLCSPEINIDALFENIYKQINDDDDNTSYRDIKSEFEIVNAFEKELRSWPLDKRNKFLRIWMGSLNIDLSTDILSFVAIKVQEDNTCIPDIKFYVCTRRIILKIAYNSNEELATKTADYCNQVLENQRLAEDAGIYFP